MGALLTYPVHPNKAASLHIRHTTPCAKCMESLSSACAQLSLPGEQALCQLVGTSYRGPLIKPVHLVWQQADLI